MSVDRLKASFFLLVFLSFSVFVHSEPPPAVSSARAFQAVVVTAHPLATQIALDALRAGGNAVDAAIAAQWVLNVVEPQSSGIGGGGFFVHFDAKTRELLTFDGREKAPLAAFPKMFLTASGQPIPFYPDRITGGLAVGVPGTLKLLKEVHERYGSGLFEFRELFHPAIELAERGFPVSRRLADAIEEERERLQLFEASRKILFHPDGTPLREGDILVQKELARTFKVIARSGIEAFYQGEIAEAIVGTVKNDPVRPGLLERSDLESYETVVREPVIGSYRRFNIYTMGPPSSGGVALLEILNILENFDLALYGPSADSFHLMMEAQKIAFEDRARFLGDPAFVDIPLPRLLSKDYARKKAGEIKKEKASQREIKVEEASRAAGSNTSHLSIRDAEGNLVSYTTTIEHIFGSGMAVPGWGFFLNNELTDFDAEPGQANSPAPGKRPRSSMTPTLIFRGPDPFLAIGSPGGSLIIPAVQEVITHVIDFEMPIESAVAAPRFAARGGTVEAEPVFSEMLQAAATLRKRGHVFKNHRPFGNVQAILMDEPTKTFIGASDPRGEGEARGY